MEQLMGVIKLISEKYVGNIVMILDEKSLTLEYSHYRKEIKSLCEVLYIEEFENKLKVKSLFGRINEITDLKGLEEIILTLQKQSVIKDLSDEEVIKIKEKYITGTKIELIKMYDLQELQTGTKGTVNFVDDMGTIHMKWENGSTLGLIDGLDEFKII